MSKRAAAETAYQKVLAYFRANRDEYLSVDDVAVKAGISKGRAYLVMRELASDGKLKIETLGHVPKGATL